MYYTSYKIYNAISFLFPLLENISIYQIRFWYYHEHGDQNDVKIIAIRCSNCEKETGLSMKNMNTNYKDIITSFVFNTLLHHVGMSCMIEAHEQLKYNMYKHNIY